MGQSREFFVSKHRGRHYVFNGTNAEITNAKTVKTPICTFDARTGVLCPQCNSKLKSGQLSDTDVEVSIKLTKAAEKKQSISKLNLVKANQVEGDYLLELEPGSLAPLRHDVALQKDLQAVLGSKVWLVEADTTPRKVLEDLFFPVRISNVNTAWLPDGSRLTKVVISGRKTERFPHDTERIARILKDSQGIDLMVEFER